MADAFSDSAKQAIWDRDKGICVYCHGPGLEIDHVIPRSKGGPPIRSNGVVTCESCNRRKKDKLSFDWLFVAFFHLLDLGESLAWLDSLYQRTMPAVRQPIQTIPDDPALLLDIMPSDSLEEPQKEVEQRRCVNCARQYYHGRPNQKFCSPSCNKIYTVRQRKAVRGP